MSIHQEPEAKKISNSSSKPAKGAFSQQPAFAALPETETTKNKIPEQTQRIKERSDDSFEKINTYADTPTSSQPKLLTKPLESVIQLETQNEELQDVQTKPLAGVIQREAEAEEELQDVQTKPLAGVIQREAEAEEELEDVQTKPLAGVIQREAATEEELQDVQTKQIQAKVVVGAPGDKYEQEADNMAAKVMAMPDSAIQQPIQREEEDKEEDLQMKPLAGSITPLVQRQEEPAEEQLQMKRTDSSLQTGGNLESQLNSTKGGGTPLSEEVRSFMEPRFGADFSQVRVHTGSEAVQMNQDLNAQAFTHQQDVYFGAGKAPGNDALTAHELTHVVQQTSAVQTKQVSEQPTVQLKCSACENEEAEVQRSPNISAVSVPGIQRWPFSDDDDKKEADNSSGGGVLDWAKEKASGAVDSVSQAGGDAVDWAKEKGGAAVDTVTQAGGDAVDWAKEKAGGAVDTVTQAGGDAVDWAKEKGEQYSNEFLENKKASVLAQINQAMQNVAGQDFIYLSGAQIATLNSHLATLSHKSQGSISPPRIAAQTDSVDSTAPPGTQPIAALTVATLLQNLQASLSAPFMSPSVSDTSDSDSSGAVQGKIQRNPAFAGAAVLVIGAAVLEALVIMGGITIIILAARSIERRRKEEEREKEREREREEEEKKKKDNENNRRPPPNICNAAIKVLEQFERLAEKLGKKIPPKRLEELNRKLDAGTITSNDLPGFLEFPGGELVGMTLSAIRILCGKPR